MDWFNLLELSACLAASIRQHGVTVREVACPAAGQLIVQAVMWLSGRKQHCESTGRLPCPSAGFGVCANLNHIVQASGNHTLSCVDNCLPCCFCKGQLRHLLFATSTPYPGHHCLHSRTRLINFALGCTLALD